MKRTYPLPSRIIAAFKELEQTTVYLDDGPLAKATAFESGGMHRLGIAVSGYFSFTEDGITYKWSFDLEDRSANGSGRYQIQTERVLAAFRQLKGDARVQFRGWLSECAKAIRNQGNELMEAAEKLLKDAAILRDLSTTK